MTATTVSAGGDQAAPTRFLKFKWDPADKRFSGQIESSDSGCVKNRKVSAVFQTPEPGTELVLASDRAGASGKFSIKIKGGLPERGKYYGYAFPKSDRCKAGVSKKLNLKP